VHSQEWLCYKGAPTFPWRVVVQLLFDMKHVCPICKKPTDSEKDPDFPFCSERCRILDLGAWSAEKYVVSDPIFDEEEILEADRRTLREGTRDNDETIH